jgi:hypothetical protein
MFFLFLISVIMIDGQITFNPFEKSEKPQKKRTEKMKTFEDIFFCDFQIAEISNETNKKTKPTFTPRQKQTLSNLFV